MTENPFIPGGILSSYKKRVGLTAEEVMEQNYWNQVRDFTETAQDYFDVVGKNERDMMAHTKNYSTRLRLNKEVNFTEDFRKRFLTKDYGNYEKYDKNSVV